MSILIERILKIEVSNSSFNIYDFQIEEVNFGREENEKNQIEQIMDDKFECNRENNVNDLWTREISFREECKQFQLKNEVSFVRELEKSVTRREERKVCQFSKHKSSLKLRNFIPRYCIFRVKKYSTSVPVQISTGCKLSWPGSEPNF